MIGVVYFSILRSSSSLTSTWLAPHTYQVGPSSLQCASFFGLCRESRQSCRRNVTIAKTLDSGWVTARCYAVPSSVAKMLSCWLFGSFVRVQLGAISANTRSRIFSVQISCTQVRRHGPTRSTPNVKCNSIYPRSGSDSSGRASRHRGKHLAQALADLSTSIYSFVLECTTY